MSVLPLSHRQIVASFDAPAPADRISLVCEGEGQSLDWQVIPRWFRREALVIYAPHSDQRAPVNFSVLVDDQQWKALSLRREEHRQLSHGRASIGVAISGAVVAAVGGKRENFTVCGAGIAITALGAFSWAIDQWYQHNPWRAEEVAVR